MTLRANELRIGNKIIGNDVYNGEVKTFERFNDSLSVVFFSDGSPSGIGEFLKDCSGVPLTEEWLLKFGFYRNNNAWEDPKKFNTDFSVWNPVGSKVFEMNSDPIMTKIEFVHQLQNIYFAVTGIELPLANHPL